MRFNLTETNPEELLSYFRVSTRLDRACPLTDFVEETAPDMYLVQSATKPVRYLVDLRAKTCECPDFVFRGSVTGTPCKHYMAAYLAKYRKPTQ